tara:strand:+ start:274 stop:438 length:165 start_codon:yes stop_codon:yes gene_type:complete
MQGVLWIFYTGFASMTRSVGLRFFNELLELDVNISTNGLPRTGMGLVGWSVIGL